MAILINPAFFQIIDTFILTFCDFWGYFGKTIEIPANYRAKPASNGLAVLFILGSTPEL